MDLTQDCYYYCEEHGIEASTGEISMMARYAAENLDEGMDLEDAISYAAEFLL